MSGRAALLLNECPGLPPDGDAAPSRAVQARVAGNALEGLDVRDGDHVMLLKGRAAEFGDIAALRVDGGATTLWKVHPEGEHVHLSDGRRRWTLPARNVETVGVVVAVLRRFD